MSPHSHENEHEPEHAPAPGRGPDEGRGPERLLGVRRPGGADDADPRFAEALRQAQEDGALARKLEAQRAFDGEMARRLQSVPIPADLKESILAARTRSGPGFSWARTWGAGLAAAAAILVGVGVRWTILHREQGSPFAKFRRVIVAEAYGGPQHLEFQSTDLGQVRAWLAARGVATNLALPEGLREMRVHGCEIVEAKGHRVAMLCLAEGAKHLHLFVAEGLRMEDLPARSAPDFERLGPVNTAAWRQGDRIYVLAGLKPQAFVTKFRKAGRWTLPAG